MWKKMVERGHPFKLESPIAAQDDHIMHLNIMTTSERSVA